ncbi:hypothetical protein [Carboxylicivirga litoralis]|uniref:hypothetical protein n=1 Tax=Carboxylicivirga litoralis TaxID=2816963 RepID=UPI0021CAFB79|nr:hypothetical protein [Carboxylicivirga sp. A043]
MTEKKKNRIWDVLLIGFMMFGAVELKAQADADDSTWVEMPRMLQKAYKERIVVIKNDTITYRHRWFIPGQYKLQYAGSIGLMSIGFGYAITPTYQPALFFGYLSENFGGSKNSVISISLKNSFYFTKQPLFKYFKPYGGLSINWGNTNNTFRRLPDYYPKEYYFQNKVHFYPFLGGELKFAIHNRYFDGVGVYTEFSAMDAYLLEAIRTEYVKPHMALSMAIGVTFYLR